ncbi:hypothetical protein HY798_00100 [Candidatus Falkowbacteria bacterium]|nr:hypothetical protein [Candidatus Falkowbacteria bacterium]
MFGEKQLDLLPRESKKEADLRRKTEKMAAKERGMAEEERKRRLAEKKGDGRPILRGVYSPGSHEYEEVERM